MTRPYQAEEKAQFDIAKPLVATMQVPLQKKLQMWEDVFISKLCLPLVMAGADKVPKLRWLASRLLSLLEEDLLLDIDADKAVAALRDMIDCYACLQGLISSDCCIQMEARDAVNKVLQKGSKGSKTIIFNAISQSEHYKKAMDAYRVLEGRWNLHESRMQSVKALVDSGLPGCEPQSLVGICRDFSMLEEELPDVAQQWAKPVAAILKEAWMQFKDTMHSKPWKSCSPSLMQSILHEAQLTFPSDMFQEALQHMGEHLHSIEVGQKLMVVVEEVTKFQAEFHCNEAKDKGAAPLLMEKIQQAQGVPCNDVEHVEQLTLFIDKVLLSLGEVLPKDYGVVTYGLQLHDLCVALSSWVPTSEARTVALQECKAILKLVSEKLAFEKECVGDPEAFLDTNTLTMQSLASMMRMQQLAVEAVGEKGTWCHDFYMKLSEEVETIINNAASKAIGMALEKLTKSMSELEKIGQGRSDGGAWDEAVTLQTSWDELVKLASTSIMVLDHKQLKQDIDVVQQAMALF